MPTPIPIHSIPGMGRSLLDHDPRNRDYPARALLPPAPRRNRTWRRGAAYDQKRTSSCVGQTFKGILNTQMESAKRAWRVRTKFGALDFYAGGQDHDEWPGKEPDYEGTSASGVCKYLQTLGLVTEFRWCFGLDDVLDTLSHLGPVAIGVNWREFMMATDVDGYIHPDGPIVGGHEVELHGINVRDRYVIGTNSWGTDWGVSGRFRLKWQELGVLLQDQGDAVTLT